MTKIDIRNDNVYFDDILIDYITRDLVDGMVENFSKRYETKDMYATIVNLFSKDIESKFSYNMSDDDVKLLHFYVTQDIKSCEGLDLVWSLYWKNRGILVATF